MEAVFVPLNAGAIAIVDAIDVDLVRPFNWTFNRAYAMAHEVRGRTMYMHRLIAGIHGVGRRIVVDHVNGDGLDNRRANLRICSQAENGRNMSTSRPHSSRFKGVSWYANYQKWEAYGHLGGRKVRLGYFTDEVDAGRAYDAFAREHYGEFARLNAA